MPKCLSKQEIREFLADQLDAEQRDSVVVHVENCESCQSAIERFLDNQTIHQAANGSTSVGPFVQGESKLSKVTNAIKNRTEKIIAEPLPSGQLPVLAGYKIVGEVGRGASGIVYEALQEELDRRVAIKLISGQLFNQKDLQQRFLREAKSVATLNHPNIAQLFQISEDSPYGPYLVFEFVDAKSLEDLIHAKQSLRPKKAVQICRAIVSAAQHAHERHLVHRDLKPSNVLLENETQKVKVIDFGLAVDPEQQSRLTLESFIAGTPAYMSPEQIETPRDIDHRSDLYSLGVIFYEMLTGDVPFRGLSKKTLSRVIDEEPQPLTTINPDIPADLETICLKLLNKSPDQRYQTMQELDEDLLRWQEGRPILAKPVSNFARAYRWMRRNSLVASLGAIVASLLIIVTVVSTYGVWMLSSANAETMKAKKRSDAAAQEAIQQRDQLLKTIDSLVYEVNDHVDAEYIDQDELQVLLLQIAQRGLGDLKHEASHEIARRVGDINLRLATVHIRNHQFRLAEAELRKTLKIAKNLLEHDAGLWDAQRLRSFAKWEQVNMDALRGQLDLAEIGRQEAVRFDEKFDAFQGQKKEYYNYLIHRGYALVNLGIGYFSVRAASSTAIEMLNSVNKDMAIIVDETEADTIEEIDNFRYQAMGLQQYVVEGLGDCYFDRNELAKAARFDSQYVRFEEMLSLYDDGDLSPVIIDGVDPDENIATFNALSTLERTEKYYRYLLGSIGQPSDRRSTLLVANRHFRMGNLFALWGRFKEALVHYESALGFFKLIKPSFEISKFEMLALKIDIQIRMIEVAAKAGVADLEFRSKLANLLDKLQSLAENEDEFRKVERLTFDLNQL